MLSGPYVFQCLRYTQQLVEIRGGYRDLKSLKDSSVSFLFPSPQAIPRLVMARSLLVPKDGMDNVSNFSLISRFVYSVGIKKVRKVQ